MVTVRSILKVKGTETLSAEPSLPIREALVMMAENNVGSILVIAEGRPVGLFEERAFTRAAAVRGRMALDGVIGDAMVTDITCVRSDTGIEECMMLMTERRTRHLPVVDDDELMGIVSIGDVLKQLIDDREVTIEHLERYIRGR
jgi:CBS domain-containing protein